MGGGPEGGPSATSPASRNSAPPAPASRPFFLSSSTPHCVHCSPGSATPIASGPKMAPSTIRARVACVAAVGQRSEVRTGGVRGVRGHGVTEGRGVTEGVEGVGVSGVVGVVGVWGVVWGPQGSGVIRGSWGHQEVRGVTQGSLGVGGHRGHQGSRGVTEGSEGVGVSWVMGGQGSSGGHGVIGESMGGYGVRDHMGSWGQRSSGSGVTGESSWGQSGVRSVGSGGHRGHRGHWGHMIT